MKTKFIIHGGHPEHINTENDSFFREILKDTSKPKILLVYFGKEDEQIPEVKEGDIAQFERNCGENPISFEVADATRFIEQIKSSDIIYLRGGSPLKLLETLKRFPNLGESFDQKVVVGETAGIYAISSFFFSKSAGGVFEGLGIIPIKVIGHYTGENSEKFPQNPQLEMVLLRDYQYKVLVV